MHKKKLNIAFYVSGKASRLRKIIEGDDRELMSSTRLVVSDSMKNIDLSVTLKGTGIFFNCFEYERLKGDKKRNLSDKLLQLFQDHQIDYCFCFGDHILKGALLELYKNRIINFHPSILPSFKGRNAIDQAIREGAILLGNTAHFLTEKLDGGPIIMQSVIHISKFESEGYDAVLDQQLVMVKQIFDWISNGKISIADNRVHIKNIDFKSQVFFPGLQ